MDASTLAAARALLFIPALEKRFLDKAHRRGAGAIIIDLEDSIAPTMKDAARAALGSAVRTLRENGVQHVVVRTNAGNADDVRAAVAAGTDAVLLPKVETVLDVDRAASCLGSVVPLILLVETPRAVVNVAALAAHSRVVGLVLGSEDLALSLQVEPTAEALLHAAQAIVMAARAFGKVPLGVPGSLASLADDGRFAEAMALGRRIGMAGAVCIHPNQVAQVNAAFRPDEEALAEARRVLAAFETAILQGKGAVSLDGKMLDLPIVERARALVESSAR